MTLFVTLFLAGLLTILLPCILPLIPIVLGVSIAGRSKLRPLYTIVGMLLSFVGFTFLLLIVLSRFVELADYIRIGTFYVLLLFGLGFITMNRSIQWAGAILGAFFFLNKGLLAVFVAAVVGILLVEVGGRIATRIQQFGADLQAQARGEFGESSPITAFIIGLTLGLVWVPCAGPALGFAFTLVREEPGPRAALTLFSYGLGTAVPLLIIGYGGQYAVHSVRALSQYSGRIKQVAGALLILSAIGLQFHLFEKFQIWLLDHTNFGDLGTRIEERLFERDMYETMEDAEETDETEESEELEISPRPNPGPVTIPTLPKITQAPEFSGLGPWHNSEPLTMASLRGKVVLVDFWTYSCINCIRTLPYIRGYWDTFENGKLTRSTSSGENGKLLNNFVIIGVHTPEFVFEKSEKNVTDAIKRHGLTYPIAQDNDFGTWNAFANRYWPAKYLIDAEGYIRYQHFGEGAYEETEEAIRSLLQEIGVRMNDADETEETNESEERLGQSPETYLGSRSWESFGNARTEPVDAVMSYEEPSSLELHKYYLVGEWQLLDEERQVLRSPEGEIRGKFLGSEINLVLGLEESAKPVEADVFINGVMTKSITIDRNDLFNLFEGDHGVHDLRLVIHGRGVAGYAFTFGS